MVNKPKQKPLFPTLKEKKRYLAYNVHGLALPSTAGKLLVAELQRYLGIFGSAKAGLLPITYDAEKQLGIFRVSNESAPTVRALLLLIRQLQGKSVMIQPLLMSGVLKKTKQAISEV